MFLFAYICTQFLNSYNDILDYICLVVENIMVKLKIMYI